MNNLEERLRSEFATKAKSTSVNSAPSVDALGEVVGKRRRRNRVAAAGAAVAAGAVVLVGGYFAVVDSPSTQIATGAAGEQDNPPQATSSDDTDQSTAEPEASDSAQNTEASTELGTDDALDSTPEPANAIDSPDAATNDGSDSTEGADTRSLQASPDPLTVQSRASAVDFVGGSGVLVVADGDGFRGLATRFADSGSAALGLVSPNGLDWEEVALSGVPAGASPVAIESVDGTHVAQFERNISAAGAVERQVWIGTSTDLVAWDVGEPLAGSDVIATNLLVGANGVVVLGDNFDRAVWSGPIGGPYEVRAPLPLDNITDARVIDGQFVVMGNSNQAPTALRSTDGITWTSGPSPSLQSDLDLEGLIDDVFDIANIGETSAFLGGTDNIVVGLADDESFATAEITELDANRRVEIVAADSERVIVLAQTGSGLTWIVASR